jgi:hypothetical protein
MSAALPVVCLAWHGETGGALFSPARRVYRPRYALTELE